MESILLDRRQRAFVFSPRVLRDSRQASSIRPFECIRAERAVSRQALPRGQFFNGATTHETQ